MLNQAPILVDNLLKYSKKLKQTSSSSPNQEASSKTDKKGPTRPWSTTCSQSLPAPMETTDSTHQFDLISSRPCPKPADQAQILADSDGSEESLDASLLAVPSEVGRQKTSSRSVPRASTSVTFRVDPLPSPSASSGKRATYMNYSIIQLAKRRTRYLVRQERTLSGALFALKVFDRQQRPIGQA